MFAVCGNGVSGQTNPGYETITTAQGLSQGLINDMIQDREGFIWIATKGGLNRYDGYSFKTFTTDPQDSTSISSNAVSNLLEDSRGRIWIGTYDAGVNVYDKRTGRFLRISEKPGVSSGLSGNRIVSALVELTDDRILVCPQGRNMNIIALPENSLQPRVSQLLAPGNREVMGAGVDNKGFIWIGCADTSIFVLNASSLRFDLLTDGKAFTGLINKIGTQISARSSQDFFLTPFPTSPENFIDSTGQILPGVIRYTSSQDMLVNNWFYVKAGSVGNNLYDFSAVKAGSGMNDLIAGYLKTNVPDQTVKCLLLDRSGVLWVGTLGHGIYKYRIGSDRFKPILRQLSIQRINVLNNDVIYVSGWHSVQTITPLGLPGVNPLATVIGNDPATVVLQAQNGDYWAYILGQKKVVRYSKGLQLIATYSEPVNPEPTEQLQPIIEDHLHRIWVCGANGSLACIDGITGKLSRFVIDTDQPTGTSTLVQTTAFYEDGQGILWMGTEHGFARLEFTAGTTSPQVKWFTNTPGSNNCLSYNYVSWFMNDPVDSDVLWISTKGGGLNRLQKSTGQFIHYTTKQGLPNDIVYGTLTDTAGNIWGSTNRGLFCMLDGTGKGNKKPVFRIFGTSDGLQADEFNTNAFGKLSNGDLAFGGVNGMNIFTPGKVLMASFAPNVFITGIQIGNTLVTPGDRSAILRETIEETPSITLNYLQDVLTLEFASLDFNAPQQNKYRYRLEGIEEEWVESGTRRTATYLHLPSGNYTFKVQGSNSQGVWSNHTAALRIKVLPPWWRSWWAYVVYAALIALAVRAYLRFTVNKAKLQSQLNYEQLEARRVKELDTVKTQLYTNITHEFRTPLTVILGMAQQVTDKPTEHFATRMDMIVRNGRSLLNLVNQLLDLSKLETGKMQLQLSDGDIIYFLRYVVESFHSLAESQQKQLHFLTDIDVLHLEYDREKLRQIISNLLSNAIKFTPEKGNIYINVFDNPSPDNSGNSLLVIKVKDTGIGIPEDQLQYVFDRFYQFDNSHSGKTEGTGIGLALTKELVKLMEGDISVKSPPAGAFKGSEFTVALPLKKTSSVAAVAIKDMKQESSSRTITQPDFVLSAEIGENKNVSTPLILLVEDNADVVAYTASCLPEYRLAVGKDGREGFDIATEMVPDLIITDVMMPFMDGFQLVNQLRRNENTSHIPIIMLTAKADINSKIEGLQQGADAYLEKPFNKKELLVRIKKLLEMRKNLQQYYLKKAGIYGDMAIEPPIVPDKINDHAIENSFVKRVREVVEQHLTDVDFTVDKLSKYIFMSHSQVHRKLDALTGCSPNKFIRMIRLKKAKELLQNSSNSIASVAMDCGYNDPGYFARVFKQEYGITPQEWRTGNV